MENIGKYQRLGTRFAIRNHYFCRLMRNWSSTLFLFLGLVVFTSSCSQYDKLLKSTDYEKMYTEAKRYYDKKDYGKASQLLDVLLVQFKGDPRFQEVYLMYAYSRYGMEEIVIASYHFNNFYQSFPNNPRAEEALYMHVYCEYLDSYPYYLDPSVSRRAMDEIQLFINLYPESEYVEECNNYLDVLRGRLRKKSLESALLYLKMEDYMAAQIALKNTIQDFPELENRDEVMSIIVECQYKLAIRSISTKKEERLKEVDDLYTEFVQNFGAKNKYHSKAKNYKEQAEAELRVLAINQGYAYYNAKQYEEAGEYFLEQSKRDEIEQKQKLHYLSVKSYYKQGRISESNAQTFYELAIKTADEYMSRFGTDSEYADEVLHCKKKAQRKLNKILDK